MDVVDEDGVSNLAAALNQITQQNGTTTRKDALAAFHVNAALTKEVVELVQELIGSK